MDINEAEEAGVEPTEDTYAPSNGFEARAPHRERYSSALILRPYWRSAQLRFGKTEIFCQNVLALFTFDVGFQAARRLRMQPDDDPPRRYSGARRPCSGDQERLGSSAGRHQDSPAHPPGCGGGHAESAQARPSDSAQAAG